MEHINTDYFSIRPPRLEDAGLEDPALPVEGIQEAFRRAAELVKSKGGDMIPNALKGCTEAPGPSFEEKEVVVDLPGHAGGDPATCVDPKIGGMPVDKIISLPIPVTEDAVIDGKSAEVQSGEDTCVVVVKDPRL